MAASPAVAAVLSDLLWCLGIGCLLGAGRQTLGLVLGEGPLRCFCWDILAFAAAAVLVSGFSAGVSASGLARWYMATGILIGLLAWYATIGPAIQRMLKGLLGIVLWPLRMLEFRCFKPLGRGLKRKVQQALPRHTEKKAGKKAKNGKKQLQKPSKILYN